jgi:adenylate cyclase
MGSRAFIIAVLLMICLSAYLFASAPPPLSEDTRTGLKIPIERMFAMAEAENDVVRALWTQEIVGAGKKAGLRFNEDWREQDVEAGPLPALFLRETAKSLERHPVRLSLFLGSDFPINDANRFEGLQHEKFQLIKQTRASQFFLSPDTGLYTAMFEDVAVVEPCVQCHNDHKQSPKNDWKLHDVMGATTWMYPDKSVTVEELMTIITALRQGFREAYSAYLTKAETFSRRPEIGKKWPRDGYYLPTVEVFMAEAMRRASPETLATLFSLVDPLSPLAPAAEAVSSSEVQEKAVTAPESLPKTRAGVIELAAPSRQASPAAQPSSATISPALRVTEQTQGMLGLYSRAESWVEVKDATGKQLLQGLLSGKEICALRGVPPFQVVLGNPRAIVLDYNRQPVDTQIYAHRKVARFEVGK